MPAADPRRRIPQVDRITSDVSADAGLPRPVVVDAVRHVVEAVRDRARHTQQMPSEAEVYAMVRDELDRRRRRLLRPVINATGVVLHTNLGRAPLSERAVEAVSRVARGYSNLEFDLERGVRGDRFDHVEPLLAVATGAESALVVNNNAAAVLLTCAALGAGREVVISRGELIEIGGSFRIPDVLAASGAILREVGTTNRTRLADYERAIGDRTAFLLAVHPSNYRVVGFTATVAPQDLSALARAKELPFVYDAGSGLLGRPLSDEPLVHDAVAAGADVVCFSGDKLLGGPQAGIICGRRTLVDRLRTHPLLRAVRPDKMTLAALEATVFAYLDDDLTQLPVWRMLGADPDELRRRCTHLADRLRAAGYEAQVAESASVAGGGSLPGHEIPSPVITVRPPARKPAELASALRRTDVPIVVRVEDRAVIVDLRTVPPEDDDAVAAAFDAALPD